MSARRVVVGAVFVVLAAAGVGSWWMRRPVAPPVSVSASAPRAAPVVLTDREPQARCDFKGNALASYQLSVETRGSVRVDQLGLVGQAPMASTQVSHLQLHLKPVSHEPDGTVLLAAFRGIQGGASAMPELNTPFLLKVDARCELTAFARKNGVDRATARAQQAFLHELQWRFAPGRADLTGENGQGAWSGVTVASATDQGTLVQRRIVSYSQTWDTHETGLVPSESLLTVLKGDDEAWFDTARAEEALETRVATLRTVTVATRMQAVEDALLGVDTNLSGYVWENLLPRPAVTHEPRAVTARDLREREAVRGLTAAQSLDAYVRRVKEGKGIAETWPPLTTYLEARPDQTGAIVQQLKTELPGEATMGVYIALGRARTPEALSALLDITRDPAAPTFERTRAMFSLVDRDDVGVDLARELAAHSSSLLQPSQAGSSTFGAEALLALTTMSGLRGDPAVHDVALQAVDSALVGNRELRTLKPVLMAMANVGDPVLLERARPFMTHADPKVRREAAIVFRRMPADTSLPVALEWLGRERDLQVRGRVFDAVELQLFDAKVKTPSALAERAAAELATQPSAPDRKTLVRLLARAEDLTPQVREQLKAQARKELAAKSGLFDVIAPLLSAEDLQEVVP